MSQKQKTCAPFTCNNMCDPINDKDLIKVSEPQRAISYSTGSQKEREGYPEAKGKIVIL